MFIRVILKEENILSSMEDRVKRDFKSLPRSKRDRKSKLKSLAILENARESIKAQSWAKRQLPFISHQSIVEGISHSSPLDIPYVKIGTGRVWKRKVEKIPEVITSDESIKEPEIPTELIEDMSLHYGDFLARTKEKGIVETAELFTENEMGD
jgi:hypothetical protein